jgi:hypothetical protein
LLGLTLIGPYCKAIAITAFDWFKNKNATVDEKVRDAITKFPGRLYINPRNRSRDDAYTAGDKFYHTAEVTIR